MSLSNKVADKIYAQLKHTMHTVLLWYKMELLMLRARARWKCAVIKAGIWVHGANRRTEIKSGFCLICNCWCSSAWSCERQWARGGWICKPVTVQVNELLQTKHRQGPCIQLLDMTHCQNRCTVAGLCWPVVLPIISVSCIQATSFFDNVSSTRKFNLIPLWEQEHAHVKEDLHEMK